MNFDENKYKVSYLAANLDSGSLSRNPEYQRGEVWTTIQKAGFVDSIFRGYPLPPLFLHRIESPGLDGTPIPKWEVVDGQQRLSAIRDYYRGNLQLLTTDDRSKLRLPRSLREQPAPWAGHYFHELPDDIKSRFTETVITTIEIGGPAHPDEIRDVFIRLQGGTALSRQQIRDAWPGNLGPFIEQLGGKVKKPCHKLLAVIDRRGQRQEEEDLRDEHVFDRQVCAQLLRIYLARERDATAYPSVSANELDAMYHDYTDFDVNGATATAFKDALWDVATIFEKAKERLSKSTKFKRFDVAAVMMYVQDVSKNDLRKKGHKFYQEIANRIAESLDADKPLGKGP